MRDEVLDKVIEIIREEAEIEEEITGDCDLFDDLELSSLEIFTVFSTLEDEFGKKVSEKEISKISTVDDIVELFI